MQLVDLVMSAVRQMKLQHPDLANDNRLNVSFTVFVICGYFLGEVPQQLRKVNSLNNIKTKPQELAQCLQLDFSKIVLVDGDIWDSYVKSTYQTKTLKNLYDQDPKPFDIINSFSLFLLLHLFGNLGNVNFALLKGKSR